jgi:hypothetical protein
MNAAADLIERSVSETLTYYAFPDIHWQKIRTTDEIDKGFLVDGTRCGNRERSVRAGTVKGGRVCGHPGPGSGLRRAWNLRWPTTMVAQRGRPRGEAWRVG